MRETDVQDVHNWFEAAAEYSRETAVCTPATFFTRMQRATQDIERSITGLLDVPPHSAGSVKFPKEETRCHLNSTTLRD